MAKDPYKLQVVVKNGKPVAVLLDIAQYESLLEIAEQKADLKAIKKMKAGDWETMLFDDYLNRKRRRASA